MSEPYNPLKHSIVQAVSGTWCRYEADDFVGALFSAILDEIDRVHWNVYQHKWSPTWHGDSVDNPEIPGISFTRYYDGCPCEDEPEHRPECRHARPNFQHEDVQFRWYKWPGRGMSTNKDWTADEWRAWFGRCLKTVRAFDAEPSITKAMKRREVLRAEFDLKYPKAQRIDSTASCKGCEEARNDALRAMFAMVEASLPSDLTRQYDAEHPTKH